MRDLSESRILIVDDTRANLDILVAGLKDHYKLNIALDGETALRRVRNSPPDLILLDIMMPGMDGYEVCRRLKADPATREIPVMFLSALDEANSKAAGFEAGGTDYVTKPFDLVEVRARVQSLLKAKAYSDHVAAQVQSMQTGLRSFSKFVPEELVESLLASGREASQAAERRVVTVSISDIQGFTTIAEHLDPEQLVAQLGDYLEALSGQILEAGGTIDKYIGDSILTLWGAPLARADHATVACRAMLDNQQRVRELNARWHSEGRPAFHTRIGISTGEVVVGVIGSRARLNYTVLGDNVNLASRLEGLCKEYRAEILISEATFRAAESDIVARPLDWVEIRGRIEPVAVYELLAMRGEAPGMLVRRAAVFAQAVDAFRQQAWDEADSLLDEALKLCPEDRPARLLQERCRLAREADREFGRARPRASRPL
jgi:adenylate cyclase